MVSDYSWCCMMAGLLENREGFLLFLLSSSLFLVTQSLPLRPQHTLILFILFILFWVFGGG